MGLEFNEDKITKLSSEIFNALTRLKGLSDLPQEKFLKDPYMIAGAKYFLIVAIEAAIDLCNHIISKNKLRAPEIMQIPSG